MALAFVASTTDKVNCDSGASLDNVQVGTLIVWCYPTSITTFGTATNKGGTMRVRVKDTNTGDVYFFYGRSVQGIDSRSTANALVANAWQCIACRWDFNGASSDQQIFVGSLTVAATEVSYANQSVGSGTNNNSADNLFVGNVSATGTASFPGRIAFAGLWNRYLTLGEIHAQQFRPHVTSGCVLFVELGYAGTSTQPDWSGNGNNGTVTGATVADHVPIPFRRSGPLYVPYTVAALGNTWPGYQSASGWY